MQDAFAYCAALVRAADRDRFLATLFAPAERRGALHALFAFNTEVARVHEVAPQALAGEVRLQWWIDVLAGERQGEAAANPVAAALLTTLAHYRLAAADLIDLVEARRFDLYEEPMSSLADLENYARKTSSRVFALAAEILSGERMLASTEPAGIAYGIAVLLRAFPAHAARRQLYVPVELLERHQVPLADVFAGRPSAGLNAALAELRHIARRHLAAASERTSAVPAAAVPALLPIALVRPSLDRLERCVAFAPAEIPPWRRQWLIWRAAHNPARIAQSG